jgi:hypothetical protein
MFRMRQVHPAASLKVFDVGEHTPLFQACTNSITLFEAQPPNSSPLGSSTQGESMLGRFLAVGVLIGLAAVEFGKSLYCWCARPGTSVCNSKHALDCRRHRRAAAIPAGRRV